MSAAVKFDQDQESRLREAIRGLEESGDLSAGSLLELARPDDSDIHDCFEWQDEVAAEHFRMHQARTYIRTIRINVQHVEATDRKLRIVEAPKPAPVATPEAPASPPPTTVELMVGKAREDLKLFHQKYRFLRNSSTEFVDLFDLIEQLVERWEAPTHPALVSPIVTSSPRPIPEPAPALATRADAPKPKVKRAPRRGPSKVVVPEVLRRENLPMRPPGR